MSIRASVRALSRRGCAGIWRAACADVSIRTGCTSRTAPVVPRRPLHALSCRGPTGAPGDALRAAARSHRVPGPSFAGVRTFFIQTAETPNPNSLKFLPGREVLPEAHGSGMHFSKGDRDSKQSPLAKALFNVEGVQSVFLGRDFLTVTKEADVSWPLLKPVVFGCVMDFYAEGKAVVLDEPVVTDTTILPEDDEVVSMIKELLEERVRPAVQEDGGDIFYRGFNTETGIVSLQLAGACSGCPSSSVTLKNGVENMLMHYIPEVSGVEEVEDDELNELNNKEVNMLEERLRAAGIPSD